MNTLMDVLIAALDSLWQGALLTGLVWLALRFARGMNAATRFAIWWAVLGVVLVLPAVPHLISAAREWLQPATMQAARPLYAAAPSPTQVGEFSPLIVVDHRVIRWPIYVAALWGLILLYRLVQLLRSYLRVRNIKRSASIWNESPARPIKGTRVPFALQRNQIAHRRGIRARGCDSSRLLSRQTVPRRDGSCLVA